MRYAVYNREDGYIYFIISGTYRSAKDQCRNEEGVVKVSSGVDDGSHYILKGGAVRKKTLDTKHVISGLTVKFSGLPAGLTVSVDEEYVVTDDDPLEVSFDMPGTYHLRLHGLAPFVSRMMEVTIDG